MFGGSFREIMTATGSCGVFSASGPVEVFRPAETVPAWRTALEAASPRSAGPPLRPPLGHNGTPQRVDRRPVPQPLAPVINAADRLASLDSAPDGDALLRSADRTPAEQADLKPPRAPQQPYETPRVQARSKFNVTWSSSLPSSQHSGVRRRYFFTHRGFDDERASQIPGHFDGAHIPALSSRPAHPMG